MRQALEQERRRREHALEQERLRQAQERHRQEISAKPWPEKIKRAVLEKQIEIGMTSEQVTASWGRPQSINETITATSRQEQWTYPGPTYLYFTRLALGDLSFERVLRFVRYLEDERHNQIRTRNQRVACLHTFFDYLAGRVPEFLEVAERVAAIPMKRVPPPETRFLEREDIDRLFATLPARGARALRDRALLLFLYNTGARVQEAADLHVNDLELAPPARVRLHGKGDKWRTCPLWAETAQQLRHLLDQRAPRAPDTPVFASRQGHALTRFGIYKLVRRLTRQLETIWDCDSTTRRASRPSRR
jgi:integrase